jgi:hypothetical protein
MGVGYYTLRIKAVLYRPRAPYARHGGGGINQHPIHVKQNSFGGKDQFPE